MLEIRRQAVLELQHIPGDVQLAAFNALVKLGTLLDQENTEDNHGQDRNQQTDAQCEQRREIALPAELQLQLVLQGRKEDPEDHRPEHRAVKRQQYPDERDAHQKQQDGQRFVSERFFVHVRSMPVRRT
ncbi:hypothetical protein D3C81_1730110 [compost metagenome]